MILLKLRVKAGELYILISVIKKTFSGLSLIKSLIIYQKNSPRLLHVIVNLTKNSKKIAITHLDTVKQIVNRNGSLRADFFRDIYEVERARRKINEKEIEMIRDILQEGIRRKIFKRMDLDLSSVIIFHLIKGMEVPYIRQKLTKSFEENKEHIISFIFDGVRLD